MDTEPDRDARELANRVATHLAELLDRERRGPLRLRVERHTLPDGRTLASFEVRSRIYGTRVVVHVEPGL